MWRTSAAPKAGFALSPPNRAASPASGSAGFFSRPVWRILAPELIAYFRPQDVVSQPVETAGPGLPATLEHCVFEAGSWLAYWRVAGLLPLVCSRETQKPGMAARLTIPGDKIFLYPRDKE